MKELLDAAARGIPAGLRRERSGFDQLDVDEATFWAAVRDRVKPTRAASTAPSRAALPAEVAFLLINRVGLTREQVAAMTKVEAIERLNRYWTEGA